MNTELIIVLALIFFLSSCGGGSSDPVKQDPIPTPPSIPVPDPTPDPTPTPGPSICNIDLQVMLDKGGNVYLPSGQCVINKAVNITKSGTVIIGNNTTLVNAYIKFDGDVVRDRAITNITKRASRGDTKIIVSNTSRLRLGVDYSIYVMDDDKQTLIKYLYQDKQGDISKLPLQSRTFIVQITSIDGKELTLSRPLRFDLEKSWNPRIREFKPTLVNVGIENVRLEYTETNTPKHLEGESRFAVSFSKTSHCWSKNIEIHNANNGMSTSGFFCKHQNITITSGKYSNSKGVYGHHGFTMLGSDNVLTNYRIETLFRHDITVSGSSMGNLIDGAYGENLSLDFHRHGNFGNTFKDIDTGYGTRLWYSGGNVGEGRNAGAFNVMDNVYPWTSPPSNFGAPFILK